MKIITNASASLSRQVPDRIRIVEELLAFARDLDSLYVAINAARGRLDALRSSLDAVEEAHRSLGHSFGALAAVATLTE